MAKIAHPPEVRTRVIRRLAVLRIFFNGVSCVTRSAFSQIYADVVKRRTWRLTYLLVPSNAGIAGVTLRLAAVIYPSQDNSYREVWRFSSSVDRVVGGIL